MPHLPQASAKVAANEKLDAVELHVVDVVHKLAGGVALCAGLGRILLRGTRLSRVRRWQRGLQRAVEGGEAGPRRANLLADRLEKAFDGIVLKGQQLGRNLLVEPDLARRNVCERRPSGGV